MTASIIIYGPQGSGKTRHAPALLKHFGLSTVEEEWETDIPVKPTGVLHLTHENLSSVESIDGVRVVSIDKALREIR